MDDWRALTVTQPHASLLALGQKTIETRSWTTDYRGRVLIHASKALPREAARLAAMPLFREALGCSPEALPLGAVVASARIVNVLPTHWIRDLSAREQLFGDYTAGRFGWYIADVVRLPEPIKWTGRLGLWTVPPELRYQVERQIGAAA
ncbi:MAG: ASCH domain-containing protein [Vicinamibacterales bacterium]